MEKIEKQEIILEQYKLCLQMADSISQRRLETNKFFSGLNSLLVSIIGIAFSSKSLSVEVDLMLSPVLIIGVIICYIWYRMIKSFRQLNTAKFKVIGKLEKYLPFSPFYEEEWKMLGEGKDKRLYTPFSKIEQYIPLLLGISYILFVIMLIMKIKLT